VVIGGVGFATLIVGFVMPKEEQPIEQIQRPTLGDGTQENQAVSVTSSPGSQAVGRVEGVSIGAGASLTNPVFNLGAETSRAGTSDALELKGPGPAEDTLPLRNPTFTGRAEELESLERRLANGRVAVVAVRGLGGIGKSQLALEYAYRMRQSGRYQLVGWVRADSPVTIDEDLAALAPLLGLSTEGTIGEVVAQVVGALQSRRDWLVIFDNAQKPGDLTGLLPTRGGHVLITSRNRVWSGIAAQVDLGEFSRAESVKFVCERSGSDEPGPADELAEELGDLPLALAQAAAYIDTRSMTVRGYLDLYRDPALARTLREAGLDSAEYPASVARTWLLSFTDLSVERPAAVELLRLLAFLDPDDIDLDLLGAGRAETGDILARVLGDPLERTETVGALAATSLVTSVAEGHLRVHRLVQAVTRDQLDDDQSAEWVKRALNLAAAILPPKPADYRSWPEYARLAPHIEAITGYVNDYAMLAGKIGLLWNLGIYLSESGQLRAARATYQRAVVITEAAHGPEHPDVAKSLDNLAAVELRLGEPGAARGNIERALPILEAAYGPEHLDVALALGNLGHAQLQLGELKAARASLERAIAINEKAVGPGNPEVATDLLNLTAVQLGLGEPDAARVSAERALAIQKAAHGPDHLEVAWALMSLANVQLQLGELREARTNNERARAIFKAAYGPDSDLVKALPEPPTSE
jgi:tetratricopeptide (TPR) repeat protein